MNENPILQAQNLTRRYGQTLALDSVSFQASAGEVVGLLGLNGAGKTTTLRILAGLLTPNSGEAQIAGFIAGTENARRRVGYLPERVPVYPEMTVRGYLLFWARLRGLRNPQSRAEAMLDRMQLGERRHSLIRNLSKGLRQRVGLAQALIHNPPVILLDEPTIGIDPQQVIEIRQLVRELGAKQMVLFSTHNLSEAEQVCDRVVILHRGRIMAEGQPVELRRKLQPGAHLFVVISGADPQVGHLLESIPGVESVERQGEGFAVRVQPGLDVRAELSEAVFRAGYHLLELRPAAVTLEDIFLDVVAG